MRVFWETAAKENAAWYVDTSISYDNPDMDRFWEGGRTIAGIAMDGPVRPERRDLVVEIGPGLGRILRALVEEHGFAHAVGVDISSEMVTRARQLVPDERIAFHVGSGSGLDPVQDASADLVVSFTVFQHIPDVKLIGAYIAEAGRVLRPGGVLAFQWNNTPGARRWRFKRAALALLQRSGIKPERYKRHAPEFLGSRVPLRDITQLLDGADLRLAGTDNLDTLYAWAWATKT
jgi:SAM-dependent methyltransferase